jgi:hypothetical protein
VSTYTLPSYVYEDVTVASDYAYIAAAWYGVHVVDVSDPANSAT